MAINIDFKGPSFADFEQEEEVIQEFQTPKETMPTKQEVQFSQYTLKGGKRSELAPDKVSARNREAIRDYLNKALGDAESVIIRLADLTTELNIGMNTLYRHLKVMRVSDFEFKKVFNGTQVRRRS
jgi:DNA-binding NtrC family response regulator